MVTIFHPLILLCPIAQGRAIARQGPSLGSSRGRRTSALGEVLENILRLCLLERLLWTSGSHCQPVLGVPLTDQRADGQEESGLGDGPLVHGGTGPDYVVNLPGLGRVCPQLPGQLSDRNVAISVRIQLPTASFPGTDRGSILPLCSSLCPSLSVHMGPGSDQPAEGGLLVRAGSQPTPDYAGLAAPGRVEEDGRAVCGSISHHQSHQPGSSKTSTSLVDA